MGLKYIILVITIPDVSTDSHASWISWAAVWIPGSAGQGQSANLPCDVMPLSETADDTCTQLLGCGKQEGSGGGEGREGMKGLAREGRNRD